jgi:HlyD family secretion protein
MKKQYKWIIVLSVAVVVLAGFLWSRSGRDDASSYKTSPVRRGDLAETISATGTVEPEDLIDIGAQVAGRIIEFGKDAKGAQIDYGSEVRKGMLLARIDDSTYRAQAEQAGAALNSAVANLARAKADLAQLKAKSDQARNDWERAKKLGPSDALSKSTYEGYRSAALVAEASVDSGKAAIKQAEAGIIQAKADLSRARENLGYCTIPSPVDGVVIDRRVNIGQTVVASLNAPSLFLIAKDLRNVQVWVPVNEADIGNIRQGMPVSFTVDAFPGQVFRGTVRKVRLNASMTQNVVTYTVEVSTDNRDGKLLPYLTANLQFETARADDALLVPNQALKFTPDNGNPASMGKPQNAGRTGGPKGKAGVRAKQDRDAGGAAGTVWVLEGENLRAVRVRTGISDGVDTAVTGPDIREGMAVVTGVQTAADKAQPKSTNPFMPQIPRGRRH